MSKILSALNPAVSASTPTPPSKPVTGTLQAQYPSLANDEKAVPVMLYTNQALWWGTVIMKDKLRVHMWLRTSAAPEIIHIYNPRMILQGTFNKHKAIAFKDAHILTADLIAYHLLPTEKEDLDYDPQETNRHMEAISAFSGHFRFDGNVLLSNLYNIGRYVETTHERFVSMYDVEVTYPYSSDQAPLKVPQAMVKLLTAVFASR
jgi:hypothetical protein